MTLKKNKKIFQHIENELDHFFFLSISKLNYFFNRDYKQYIQNAHTHTIFKLIIYCLKQIIIFVIENCDREVRE